MGGEGFGVEGGGVIRGGGMGMLRGGHQGVLGMLRGWGRPVCEVCGTLPCRSHVMGFVDGWSGKTTKVTVSVATKSKFTHVVQSTFVAQRRAWDLVDTRLRPKMQWLGSLVLS